MPDARCQDNLKEEEKLKKELQLRLAYAGFLQETVTAMAVKKKSRFVLSYKLVLPHVSPPNVL